MTGYSLCTTASVCPLRDNCLRATATPDPIYQPYTGFFVTYDGAGNVTCADQKTIDPSRKEPKDE